MTAAASLFTESPSPNTDLTASPAPLAAEETGASFAAVIAQVLGGDAVAAGDETRSEEEETVSNIPAEKPVSGEAASVVTLAEQCACLLTPAVVPAPVTIVPRESERAAAVATATPGPATTGPPLVVLPPEARTSGRAPSSPEAEPGLRNRIQRDEAGQAPSLPPRASSPRAEDGSGWRAAEKGWKPVLPSSGSEPIRSTLNETFTHMREILVSPIGEDAPAGVPNENRPVEEAASVSVMDDASEMVRTPGAVSDGTFFPEGVFEVRRGEPQARLVKSAGVPALLPADSRPAEAEASPRGTIFPVAPLTSAKPLTVEVTPFVPQVAPEVLEAASAREPVQAAPSPKEIVVTGTHLPATAANAEKIASSPLPAIQPAPRSKNFREATKPAPVRAASALPVSARNVASARGTVAAKNTNSMMAPAQTDAANTRDARQTTRGDAPFFGDAEELSAAARDAAPGEDTLPLGPEFFSRTQSATDWQTERPVGFPDRPSSDFSTRAGAETTVERLSQLVTRESSLLRQHNPDSLAVVLRPDAQTELFLHLSRRDGQIEATVRCERGDFQHLSAAWAQLTESLAGQKIKLSPLEQSSSENSTPQPRSHSGAHPAPEGGNFSSRREQQPRRDSESLAEWLSPASPLEARSARRESGGRRVTTSRPGWESWA